MPTPDPVPEPPPSDGWELMCAGVLRTRFGRRPTRAVANAVLRLAAEEASAKQPARRLSSGWRAQLRDWLRGGGLRPEMALAAVLAILVAGVAVWFLSPDWLAGIKTRAGRAPMCKLTDGLEVRWDSHSARPKPGSSLAKRAFRLESGVVELTFASTARVAVQGPAQFSLTDGNAMELQAGSMAAEVPKRARGFLVKTPAATITDLGTRFGAIIDSNRTTRVDVFQGQVEVTRVTNRGGPFGQWRLAQGMALTADGRGGQPAAALPETAFPQPRQIILARPQNCGFDATTHLIAGEVPAVFGYWSGPACAETGPSQGIRPYEGAGMLQFLNGTSPGGDSEVWQLVDLHSFKAVLEGGQAEARLSAFFNRVPRHAGTGDTFGLTLAAFRGAPAEAPALWASRAASALALAQTQLTADDDPATWEKVEVSARLPADTEFVIIELRAVAPKGALGAGSPFPGHFADLVDLELCTPMRSSRASR